MRGWVGGGGKMRTLLYIFNTEKNKPLKSSCATENAWETICLNTIKFLTVTTVSIFSNKLQTEHELILEADSHEAISPDSESELDEDTMAGIIIIMRMQVMIKTQCEKKVYSYLQNYTFI